MIIKNTGRKIIGFGQTSVLPEQTVTIPDTYKSTVLDTYVTLGIVAVVNKTTDKTETKTEKAAKTSGKKTTNAEVKTSDEDETKADEETEVGKE